MRPPMIKLQYCSIGSQSGIIKTGSCSCNDSAAQRLRVRVSAAMKKQWRGRAALIINLREINTVVETYFQIRLN